MTFQECYEDTQTRSFLFPALMKVLTDHWACHCGAWEHGPLMGACTPELLSTCLGQGAFSGGAW